MGSATLQKPGFKTQVIVILLPLLLLSILLLLLYILSFFPGYPRQFDKIRGKSHKVPVEALARAPVQVSSSIDDGS